MRVTVGNTVTFCMTLSQLPPIWKEAPFIRIVIPFSIGIAVANLVYFDSFFNWLIFLCSASCLISLHLSSLFIKYKFRWLAGVFIHLIFFSGGLLIASFADDGRNKNSLLNIYSPGDYLKVTIEEPLIAKDHSFKALASVDQVIKNDSNIKCFGDVILYFPKDSNFRKPRCGSSLVFSKSLQPIRSSGNPGAFDYKTYCARQGIHYSAYLAEKDYRIIPGTKDIFLKNLVFQTRETVLNIITKYIPGPTEAGFAEALLIGYREDLDKSLVESYANTGVVHIIAISGLHLGIIYWLLNILLTPVGRIGHAKWIKALLILLGLWCFTFIAGAGPSVLRSALMFSFIVLGQALSKKASIYNTLAASAFLLLCIDPYWLFDVGFQLSYAAVLSIVIFFRNIYNLLYFENKIVDFLWKLNAVTISAQILTVPITIYHFHQIPTYFLLSNLIAIPWSTLILLGEILLCTVSFRPNVAYFIGEIMAWMINFLNTYITNINKLPFSIWDGLTISLPQLVLSFIFVAGMSTFLVLKRKIGLFVSLASVLIFAILHSFALYEADRQKKIIVYNVSTGPLLEFMEGRSAFAIGDSSLRFLSAANFYLHPSHTLYRVTGNTGLKDVLVNGNLMRFHGKNVLVLDQFQKKSINQKIDVLILSHNLRITLSGLIAKSKPQLIVADGSNSQARVNRWKKECDALGISFHNVREQGALILDLN